MKEYVVSFAFGNNTDHQKYSKNIVRMTFNHHGFSIIMIPNLDDDTISIPPSKIDVYKKGTRLDPKLKRKIQGFEENQIVFYERKEEKENFIKAPFVNMAGHKGFVFIYFLNPIQYKELRLGLLKKYKYVNEQTTGGYYNKKDLIKDPNFKKVDDILQNNLKDLPSLVQTCLEYESQTAK